MLELQIKNPTQPNIQWLTKEQYATYLPSLSFNQESLSLANVVDWPHYHDAQAPYPQCQSHDNAIEISNTTEADDQPLFLEPEFPPDTNLASSTYFHNQLEVHPLHCQCLKVKLATSFIQANSPDLITQSPTKRTAHKKQILSFVHQLSCLTILLALTYRGIHIQPNLFTQHTHSLSFHYAYASLQHLFYSNSQFQFQFSLFTQFQIINIHNNSSQFLTTQFQQSNFSLGEF